MLGHAVSMLSIVDDDMTKTAGRLSTLEQDDLSTEGNEAIAISLYAGAEAERRVRSNDPATLAEIAAGAETDERLAEEHLAYCRRSEAELRQAAAELISTHWPLIATIAEDLQRFGVLLGEEVHGLHEIYLGEATHEDLARFRLFAADTIASLRGRRTPP
ncbi:MAG TPA: hypothetical protein PJ986_04075 [Gammaproteobacteria bacterium]|nr:hypothetical protein [Gammaproteobacteria bacterium]